MNPAETALPIIRFRNNRLDRATIDVERVTDAANDTPAAWIPLRKPDPAVLNELAQRFQLHPLTVEDILAPVHNNKIESYPGYLLSVVHRARVVREGSVASDPLIILYFGNLLVTIAYGDGQPLSDSVLVQLDDEAVQGIHKLPQFARDASFALFLILRAVVETFRETVDRLSDTVDEIEGSVHDLQPAACAAALAPMRRTLATLRRDATAMRAVIGQFGQEGTAVLPNDFAPFIRDLVDQLAGVVQSCEAARDFATALQELNMAFHNTRMNETMKVLTIIATIFMPLSFIAAVYGMNFRHMPELALRWAYPAVLGVMLLVGVGLLLAFRRRRWW